MWVNYVLASHIDSVIALVINILTKKLSTK